MRTNPSWCHVIVASMLIACGARTELPVPDGGSGGKGGQPHNGGGGAGGRGGAGGEPIVCDPIPLPSLHGAVRDLPMDHPDFEGPFIGDDPGIVLSELGEDDAPLYAGLTGNPSTHGEELF